LEINIKEIKMNDLLNHKAYEDVLDCKQPSLPDDEEYMECYNF